MKMRLVQQLFATVDPEMDVTFVVYVKPPGKLPPSMVLGAKEKKSAAFVTKFSPAQLAAIREMARSKSFADIAKEFNVHRSTISRYIKTEFKLGRMATIAGRYMEVQGSYDLNTGLPLAVKSPIDTTPGV